MHPLKQSTGSRRKWTSSSDHRRFRHLTGALRWPTLVPPRAGAQRRFSRSAFVGDVLRSTLLRDQCRTVLSDERWGSSYRVPDELGCEAPSDRDSLDDVSGDLAVAAVVKTGGSGVGVAGEVLHVFQGDSLAEEVGDRGDSERVGREPFG